MLYLVLFLIVVAVGGLGSLKGTLLAALVLGMFDTARKISARRCRRLFHLRGDRCRSSDQAGGVLWPRVRPSARPTADARERAADYLLRRHRFRWRRRCRGCSRIAVFFVFPDRMTFGSQVLVMVMFALSLDLILGYAGIVTLGHAAFFGVGAYTVGLAAARLGWTEPISGLFAAAIVAGLVGFVTGWFLLRYRGLTLLMLTLATAILLQETGNLRSDISGGYDGLPGLMFKPLFGIFDYDLYGHTNYLYVLAVLAVVFFFVRRIVYSPFGQALTGIRENVRRMHAIGSPVHRRLVTVYTIAAGDRRRCRRAVHADQCLRDADACSTSTIPPR